MRAYIARSRLIKLRRTVRRRTRQQLVPFRARRPASNCSACAGRARIWPFDQRGSRRICRAMRPYKIASRRRLQLPDLTFDCYGKNFISMLLARRKSANLATLIEAPGRPAGSPLNPIALMRRPCLRALMARTGTCRQIAQFESATHSRSRCCKSTPRVTSSACAGNACASLARSRRLAVFLRDARVEEARAMTESNARNSVRGMKRKRSMRSRKFDEAVPPRQHRVALQQRRSCGRSAALQLCGAASTFLTAIAAHNRFPRAGEWGNLMSSPHPTVYPYSLCIVSGTAFESSPHILLATKIASASRAFGVRLMTERSS